MNRRVGRWLSLLAVLGLAGALSAATALPAAAATGDVTEFALAAGVTPEGITTGADGNLWILEQTTGKVARMTPSGSITEFPVASSLFYGITLGPDGNVWFVEDSASKVARITPAGAVTDYPTLTGGAVPRGIAVGPDGNLWFTEIGANKIGRIKPDGTGMVEFGGLTAGAGPLGITAGPDGNLWFTEFTGSRIGTMKPDGTVLGEFATTAAASQPYGITAGPDGNLWFSETATGKHNIGRIKPDGTVAEFPIPTVTAYVRSLTVLADGNLWFAEGDADKIGRITTAGAFTEYPIPTTGSFSTVVTRGPDGQLWFVETSADKVGRLQTPVQQFYFAEGFTGDGFKETLSLFMPKTGGTAFIDYFTTTTHTTQGVLLTAGQTNLVDVNAAVGAGQQVSALVTLPGPGVVERLQSFKFGSWKGSTDKVGAARSSSEWDFAEGSSLSVFNEFLTLQNPFAVSVTVDLNYQLGHFSGPHPSKTVVLAPTSRTTIEVFRGDLSDNPACSPSGGSCGVGAGQEGVSVQAKARGGAQIIAERPFYVNGANFGSGAIHDGHDALGANAAATSWSFAEGSTLAGFNEYLTLQNPINAASGVTITYITSGGGVTIRTLVVNGLTRYTVPVFDANAPGLGTGFEGVSVKITATSPIVAERPMYIVHDFGSGAVNGAHVVVGSTVSGKLLGFARASTLAGENDFLTIQNSNAVVANVTLTYYAGGAPIVKNVAVPATTRQTIEVFGTANGVGPGVASMGIVVASDQPILVEKPSYSTNGSGGATDTLGFAADAF